MANRKGTKAGASGKQTKRKAIKFEALEPRILLSADLGIPMPLEDDGKVDAPESILIDVEPVDTVNDSRLVITGLDDDIELPGAAIYSEELDGVLTQQSFNGDTGNTFSDLGPAVDANSELNSSLDSAIAANIEPNKETQAQALDESPENPNSESQTPESTETVSDQDTATAAAVNQAQLAELHQAHKQFGELKAKIASASEQTQVIVVDSEVEDYEQLVANLLSSIVSQDPLSTQNIGDRVEGSGDDSVTSIFESWGVRATLTQIESSNDFILQTELGVDVLVIGEQSDGINSISAFLEQFQGLAAVHVLSHGSSGNLRVGSNNVNSQSLNQRGEQIKAWGKSLSDDGDFLLYGCEVAEGNHGVAFVDSLAEMLSADVAASNDITGIGGDWELEHQTGVIEAGLYNQLALASYQHSLELENTVPGFEDSFDEFKDALVSAFEPLNSLADSLNGIQLPAELSSLQGDDFGLVLAELQSLFALSDFIQSNISSATAPTIDDFTALVQTQLDSVVAASPFDGSMRLSGGYDSLGQELRFNLSISLGQTNTSIVDSTTAGSLAASFVSGLDSLSSSDFFSNIAGDTLTDFELPFDGSTEFSFKTALEFDLDFGVSLAEMLAQDIPDTAALSSDDAFVGWNTANASFELSTNDLYLDVIPDASAELALDGASLRLSGLAEVELAGVDAQGRVEASALTSGALVYSNTVEFNGVLPIAAGLSNVGNLEQLGKPIVTINNANLGAADSKYEVAVDFLLSSEFKDTVKSLFAQLSSSGLDFSNLGLSLPELSVDFSGIDFITDAFGDILGDLGALLNLDAFGALVDDFFNIFSSLDLISKIDFLALDWPNVTWASFDWDANFGVPDFDGFKVAFGDILSALKPSVDWPNLDVDTFMVEFGGLSITDLVDAFGAQLSALLDVDVLDLQGLSFDDLKIELSALVGQLPSINSLGNYLQAMLPTIANIDLGSNGFGLSAVFDSVAKEFRVEFDLGFEQLAKDIFSAENQAELQVQLQALLAGLGDSDWLDKLGLPVDQLANLQLGLPQFDGIPAFDLLGKLNLSFGLGIALADFLADPSGGVNSSDLFVDFKDVSGEFELFTNDLATNISILNTSDGFLALDVLEGASLSLSAVINGKLNDPVKKRLTADELASLGDVFAWNGLAVFDAALPFNLLGDVQGLGIDAALEQIYALGTPLVTLHAELSEFIELGFEQATDLDFDFVLADDFKEQILAMVESIKSNLPGAPSINLPDISLPGFALPFGLSDLGLDGVFESLQNLLDVDVIFGVVGDFIDLFSGIELLELISIPDVDFDLIDWSEYEAVLARLLPNVQLDFDAPDFDFDWQTHLPSLNFANFIAEFGADLEVFFGELPGTLADLKALLSGLLGDLPTLGGMAQFLSVVLPAKLNLSFSAGPVDIQARYDKEHKELRIEFDALFEQVIKEVTVTDIADGLADSLKGALGALEELGLGGLVDPASIDLGDLNLPVDPIIDAINALVFDGALVLKLEDFMADPLNNGLGVDQVYFEINEIGADIQLDLSGLATDVQLMSTPDDLVLEFLDDTFLSLPINIRGGLDTSVYDRNQGQLSFLTTMLADINWADNSQVGIELFVPFTLSGNQINALGLDAITDLGNPALWLRDEILGDDDSDPSTSAFDTTELGIDFIINEGEVEDTIKEAFSSLADGITDAVNDLDFSSIGLTALEPMVKGAFGPLEGIADLGNLVVDYLDVGRAVSFDVSSQLTELGGALALPGNVDFDFSDASHLDALRAKLNAEFGLTIESLTADTVQNFRAEIYDVLNDDFQLSRYVEQLSALVGDVTASDFSSIRDDVYEWFRDLVSIQGLVDFVTSLVPDAFSAETGGFSFDVDLKTKQIGLGLDLAPSFKQTLGQVEDLIAELMNGASDQLADLLGLDLGDVSGFVPDALEGIELLGQLDLGILSNIDLSDLSNFTALNDISVEVTEFAADLTIQGEDLSFGANLGSVSAAVEGGSFIWNVHAEMLSLVTGTAVSLGDFITNVKTAKPVFQHVKEDLDGDGELDNKYNYFALNFPIDIDIEMFSVDLDIGDLASPVLTITDTFQWLGSSNPANDGIDPTIALSLAVDVGNLLQEPVDALIGQVVGLGFVDYSLPLLNQSLESMLGVKGFLEGVVESMSTLAPLEVTVSKTFGQPAEITIDDTLFNQIEDAIEQALGLANDAVNFLYDSVSNEIVVDLDISFGIDENFLVDIDLKDLVPDAPVQLLAAAQLAISGSANFGLHFRYDLVNKLKGNGGGLTLISDAVADKVTGFELDLDTFGITDFDALAGLDLPNVDLGLDVFESLLGALEEAAKVSIQNGTASLLKMNSAGDAALPFIDFVYDELAGWQSPALNFDFKMSLPVFIADNIALSDPITLAGGLKDGATSLSAANFEFSPPDLPEVSEIFNKVKLMALINSPGFIIGELESLFNADSNSDGMFGKLKSYVSDGMANLNLPLVSGAVDTLNGVATDFGNMIDRLFGDFANDLLSSMSSIGLSSDTTMIDLIQKGLYELFIKLGDLLADIGINIGNPLINLNDPSNTLSTDPADYIILMEDKLAEGKLEFGFRMGGMLVNEEFDLDFEAGVPGIALDIANTSLLLTAELGMDVGFGFDVTANSLNEFAYLSTEKGVDWDNDGADDLEEFGIKFQASLPNVEAFASLGFLAASLKGFDADDTDSITDPVYLSAYFTGDLMDDGDGDGMLFFNELSGQFEAAVGLEAHASLRAKMGIGDLGEVDTSVVHQNFDDVLLGMGADFSFDQEFKKILNGANAGNVGSLTPDVGFDNVYLDLSGIIDGFIGDIVDEISKVTGPLQPIVDVLMDPMQLLLDLGVDERDANLLGMAKLILGATNPKYVTAIKFIEALGQIVSFVNTVQEFREANDGGLIIDLGSFDIGSSGGQASIDESSVVAKDLDTELNKNNGKKGASQSKSVVSSMSAGSFEFPILTSPMEAFKLLMGTDDVTLFYYDMPDLDFEFNYIQSFPIFTGLNARFGGEVTAKTNFDFGFDTAGLNEWRQDWNLDELFNGNVAEAFGITSATDLMADLGNSLLGGFYLDDHLVYDGTGQVIDDIAEVELSASIIAGASLGIGGLVEAGVQGDVTATIGLDLNDFSTDRSIPDLPGDGKMRLDEFVERLEHGPQCLFDMSGELSAGLEAFLWVGLKIGFSEITLFEESIELFRAVIADFEIGCGDKEPPIVAMDTGEVFDADNPTAISSEGEKLFFQDISAQGGVLTLNTGDRANKRGADWYDPLNTSPNDTSDSYSESERMLIQQKYVELDSGQKVDIVRVFYKGYYRDYVGVTSIVADLGDGSDQLGFVMDESASNDPNAAKINVHFTGGEGNDSITYAGSGTAIIYGSGGDDTLVGGNQGDFIYGGSGKDRIKGNDGADYIEGGSGDDYLYGGLGGDVIKGEGGDDQIYGDTGKTNTSLNGSEHIDIIEGGDGRDFIRGDAGADIIDGGLKGDTIDWTVGDGSDVLTGGVSSETVYVDNPTDRNILTQQFGVPSGNKLPPSVSLSGDEASGYTAVMQSPDALIVHLDSDDKQTRFEISPDASTPEDVRVVMHQGELGDVVDGSGIPLAELSLSQFEKVRVEGSEGQEDFVIHDMTGTSLYGIDLELGRGEQLERVISTDNLEVVDTVNGAASPRVIQVHKIYDGTSPEGTNELNDSFYHVEPFYYRPAVSAVAGNGEELVYRFDSDGAPVLTDVDIDGVVYRVQLVERGGTLLNLQSLITDAEQLVQTNFIEGVGAAELIYEYNNDGTPVIEEVTVDGSVYRVHSVLGGLPTITTIDQLKSVSTQYEYRSNQTEKPVFTNDSNGNSLAVYGYDTNGNPITDVTDPAVAVQPVYDDSGNARSVDGDVVYAYDGSQTVVKNASGDFVYLNSGNELTSDDQTRLGLNAGSVALQDSFGLDILINGTEEILGFDVDEFGVAFAITDPTDARVLPPQLVDIFIDPIYGLDSTQDTVTVYGSDNSDAFNIYSEEDPTQFLASDVDGAAKGLGTQVVVEHEGGVAVAIRQANGINDVLTVNAFTEVNATQQSGARFASDNDVIDASGTEDELLSSLIMNTGQGMDVLIGSQGSDHLNSGHGNDTVTGNEGVDTFEDASGIDVLVEARDRDATLLGNYFIVGDLVGEATDVYEAGAEVESILNANGSEIFEYAEISGGYSRNTLVVNDDDNTINVLVDGGGSTQIDDLVMWRGDVSLDNLSNIGDEQEAERYVVYLNGDLQATTGIVRIDDSGKAPEDATSPDDQLVGGIDHLYLLGTSGQEYVYLGNLETGGGTDLGMGVGYRGVGQGGSEGDNDYVYTSYKADNPDNGIDAKNLPFSTAVLYDERMERMIVDSSGGKDQFMLDDNRVTTDIYMGSGADTVVVGSVPTKASIADPDIQVVDESRLTSGVSTVTNIFGEGGNDSFEINHNAATLWLYGNNGDDEFVLNSYLIERQLSADEEPPLLGLQGGAGQNAYDLNFDENEDSDQSVYDYLQNANVIIDGGEGTDTIVFNGTPIDDDFVITDNFMAGVGRFVTFVNVERVKVQGGGGDDNIYVLATRDDLEVEVSGGTGADNIHVGGDNIPIELNPPPYLFEPDPVLTQDADPIYRIYDSGNYETTQTVNTWVPVTFTHKDSDGTAWYRWSYPYSYSSLKNNLIRADMTGVFGDGYRGTTLDWWQATLPIYQANNITRLTADGQAGFAELGTSNYNSILYSVGVSDYDAELVDWDSRAYDDHKKAKILSTYTYQVPSFEYFKAYDYKYRNYVATPPTPQWIDPDPYQVKVDRVDDVSNRFFGNLIIDGGDSEGDSDTFVFHNEDGSINTGSLDTIYDVQQRNSAGELLWEGADVERIERTELSGAGINVTTIPAAIDEVWMLALQGQIQAGDAWSLRIDGQDYAAGAGSTLAEQLANSISGVSGLNAGYDGDIVLVWSSSTAATLALDIQVHTTDDSVDREAITKQITGSQLASDDVIVNSAMSLQGFGLDINQVEIRNIENMDLRLNDGEQDQVTIIDSLDGMNVDLVLGAGNDEVTVLGNKANLSILGGAGNDTVTLGDSTSDLGAISGPVNFMGDAHRQEIADTSKPIEMIDVLNIDSNGVPITELAALNPGQSGYFLTDVAVFDGVGNESYNSLGEIETDMGRTVYNASQTEAQHGTQIFIDDGLGFGKKRPVLWSELTQTSIQNAIRAAYGQATLDRVLALDATYGADHNGRHGFQVQKSQFATTSEAYRPYITVDVQATAGDDKLVALHNDASGGNGSLTATELNGLGLSDTVSFADVEQVDVSLGQGDDQFTVDATHERAPAFKGSSPAVRIDAGSGDDEVIINNISDTTTIETGSGTDEVIVGQDGLVVSGIGADLTIMGSTINSDDRVTLLNNADAGDSSASNSRDGVLTDTSISELNMGGNIHYSSIDELNVFLGEANDSFIIDSTHARLTNIFGLGGDDVFGVGDVNGHTLVDGGSGADQIDLLGTTNGLDNIAAKLELIGGANANSERDVVNIDASLATTGLIGLLTGDNALESGLSGLGMTTGFIEMSAGSGWEQLNLTLGAYADTLTIQGNNAAETTIELDPSGTNKSGKSVGQTDDHLIVNQMNHEITVLGYVGEDVFDINAAQTSDSDSPTLNLDGGDQDDLYNFYLTGASGLLVNQVNTGLERGQDSAVIYGTNQADFIHLFTNGYTLPTDASYTPAGSVTVGLDAAREQVAYSGLADLRIEAGDGNDQVLADGSAVPTTILLGEGDDSFVIGTVNLEDPDNDGIRSVDETTLTPGNWADMIVEGGFGNDTFEINHNKADLYLYGQEDDDTFIVNTYQVVRIDGGTGKNTYEYLQNAFVFLDGGSGIDTLVLNGTDSDDVFVIHKDFIMGAGRFISYQNIERVQINGGKGDDQIYVLSTSVDVETSIVGGEGNDQVHIGGDHPVLQVDPPQRLVSQPAFDITYDVPVFGWVTPAPLAPIQVNGWREFYDTLYSTQGYLSDLIFQGYDVFGQINVQMTFTPYPTYEQVGTSQETVTVTPPPVVVDAPAYEFKYDAVTDLTGIQGKVLIEAGEDASDVNDQVIVHDEQGTNGSGSFVAVQEFDKDSLQTPWVENGVALYDTAELNREASGDVAISLFGAYQAGEVWYIDIHGEKYSATVSGSDMSDVADALVAAVNAGGIYSAQTNGSRIFLGGVSAIPTYEILLGTSYASGRAEATLRSFTDTGVGKEYVELRGLGQGSGTAVDGDAFAGIRIDAAMDYVEVRLSDLANQITFDSSIQGVTDLILAGGDDRVEVKGTAGEVNILGGAGDDLVEVHNDANTLSELGSPLNFSGDTHRFEQIESTETRALAGYDASTGRVGESLVQLTNDQGLPVYLDEQGFQSLEETITRQDGAVIQAQPVMIPQVDLAARTLVTATSTQTVEIAGDDELIILNTGTDADVDVTVTQTQVRGDFDQNGFDQTVNYDGVDILRVGLAGGQDKVQVEGTTARTYIETGAGDDAVVISGSDGTLDQIDGALVVDAGEGDNRIVVDDTLDVSDDSVTLDRADALYDQALLSEFELSDHLAVQGMSTADIFYTATTGDFSNGLIIQAGQGADSISVKNLYASDLTELNAGAGDDDVFVNAFDVSGRSPAIVIDGQTGDDVVEATDANLFVTVYGNVGEDTLIGSRFDDQLFGDSGDDIIIGNNGSDLIEGGTGNDWLAGDQAAVVNASGNEVNSRARTDARVFSSTNGEGVDTISGGAGDDVILGGDGGDFLFGGTAANSGAEAGTGNDTFIGDHGSVSVNDSELVVSLTNALTQTGDADFVDAGDGDDQALLGLGSDQYVSSSGDDLIVADTGTIEHSADGSSTVTASSSANPGQVSIAAEGDDAYGDDNVATENGEVLVALGDGADTFNAGSGNVAVLGDDGQLSRTSDGSLTAESNDQAIGGNDQINTGTGHDVVIGGAGNDVVDAGAGNDVTLGDVGRVETSDASGSVESNGGNNIGGDDTISGGAGNDIMIGGAGADSLNGGDGNDALIGDWGRADWSGNLENMTLITAQDLSPAFGSSDELFGLGGDDVLIGGASGDRLFGDSGEDMMSGDGGKATFQNGTRYQFESTNFFIGGDDFIDGGSGEDTIFGGTGNDSFVASLDEDVLVFGFGRSTFDQTGDSLESIITLGQGQQDLGSDALFGLYLNDEDVSYGGEDLDLAELLAEQSDSRSAAQAQRTFADIIAGEARSSSSGVNEFADALGEFGEDIKAIIGLPATAAGEPKADQSKEGGSPQGDSTNGESRSEAGQTTFASELAADTANASATGVAGGLNSGTRAQAIEPLGLGANTGGLNTNGASITGGATQGDGSESATNEDERANSEGDVTATKLLVGAAAVGAAVVGWKIVAAKIAAPRVSNADLSTLAADANKRRFKRWENGAVVNNDGVKGPAKDSK